MTAKIKTSRNGNTFVRLAARLRIAVSLAGKEQVFASKAACFDHHKH